MGTRGIHRDSFDATPAIVRFIERRRLKFLWSTCVESCMDNTPDILVRIEFKKERKPFVWLVGEVGCGWCVTEDRILSYTETNIFDPFVTWYFISLWQDAIWRFSDNSMFILWRSISTAHVSKLKMHNITSRAHLFLIFHFTVNKSEQGGV